MSDDFDAADRAAAITEGANERRAPVRVKLPRSGSRMDYTDRMAGWNDCLHHVVHALKAQGVEVVE